MMIRESFELTIQTYALVEYGGFNLNENIGTHSLKLGLSDEYIILFSIMLILNGILTASLWILYALKHNSFHGHSFDYQIFAIDAIFDTFYALFPIIAVNDHAGNSGYDMITAAAALQANSLLIFLSAVLPIIFLQRKVYYGLYNSERKSRIKWKEKLQRTMELELDTLSLQHAASSSSVVSGYRVGATNSVIHRYLNDLPGMSTGNTLHGTDDAVSQTDASTIYGRSSVLSMSSASTVTSSDGVPRRKLKRHKTSKVRHWQGYLDTLDFEKYLNRHWWDVLLSGEEFLTPSVPNMQFALNPTIYDTVSRMIENVTRTRPTIQQTKEFVAGINNFFVIFLFFSVFLCLVLFHSNFVSKNTIHNKNHQKIHHSFTKRFKTGI